MKQGRKGSKNEIIIDLDKPIVGRKPWNLLLLVSALVLVLHPLVWILLIHDDNYDADQQHFIFSRVEYFSKYILTATTELASRSFTVALAGYCIFVASIKLFPRT
jgi:hypothetical protein